MNFSPKLNRLARVTLPRALAVAVFAITGVIVAAAAPAYCFPWSIDMFRGSTVQPLAVAPRVMPEGTLPVNGIHQNIHYGEPAAWQQLEPALHPMTLEQMTVRVHNPYKPTPQRLAHGKFLYLTDCAPCHGDNGKGDGPVAHLLRHPAFDLMKDVVRNIPDGFIYGYIRNGGIWMPSYNDSMTQSERWDVLMYLRDLQAKTPPEKETSTSSAAAATRVASK